MAEIGGMRLTEEGEEFLLTVTDRDGKTTKIKLSDDQLMTLAQSAPAMHARIHAKRSPIAEGIGAVVATPVAQVGLNEDSLGQEILLTLIAPSGGQLTFALSVPIAEDLAKRLAVRAAKLKNKSVTRN